MTINTERLAAAVANLINTNLLQRINIVQGEALNVTVKHPGKENERVDFYLDIQQDFGVFSLIITEAKIGVRAEPHQLTDDQNTIWVSVNLWYEHPGGGRNGSTVVDAWFNAETYTLVQFRKPGA